MRASALLAVRRAIVDFQCADPRRLLSANDRYGTPVSEFFTLGCERLDEEPKTSHVVDTATKQ
jgi:hypothetical protein